MEHMPMNIDSTEGNVPVAASDVQLDGPHTTPMEHKFNPYDNNGGTNCCWLYENEYWLFYFVKKTIEID